MSSLIESSNESTIRVFLKKKFDLFKTILIILIRFILNSLNVLLFNWEFFIKTGETKLQNGEGKNYYLLNLVSTFFFFIIKIILLKQKCVIVQFLLEVNKNYITFLFKNIQFLEENKVLKNHEEILCKYIHEICIENYDLIRMVIFQVSQHYY